VLKSHLINHKLNHDPDPNLISCWVSIFADFL